MQYKFFFPSSELTAHGETALGSSLAEFCSSAQVYLCEEGFPGNLVLGSELLRVECRVTGSLSRIPLFPQQLYTEVISIFVFRLRKLESLGY